MVSARMIQPMTGLNSESSRRPMITAAAVTPRHAGGEHPADVVPSRVLVERGDRRDISRQQHRQHDTGRLARAEQKGEDHDVEEADAGETGLAEADAERAEAGQQPLEWSQVRQSVTIPAHR